MVMKNLEESALEAQTGGVEQAVASPETSQPIQNKYGRPKKKSSYISTKTIVDVVGNIHSAKKGRLERREEVHPETIGIARIPLTQRLNIPLLEEKLRDLAGYCFKEDALEMQVNQELYIQEGNSGHNISIDVKLSDSGMVEGKVEFDFGELFRKRIEGTALFIQELARYTAADPALEYVDIIRLAYMKTPSLDRKTAGQYRVSFEFDDGKVTLSFRTNDAIGSLKNTEFLDMKMYKFAIARSNHDSSHLVFERYHGQNRMTVDASDMPEEVQGPDGRLYSLTTPGCIDNYVIFVNTDLARIGSGEIIDCPADIPEDGKGVIF
ncbi:hypothetical protein JW898_05155 [Candidatus Woesearchaeota archaeon]|nr:hypothetical protein [Candidatus Woesearchaeota archaeon]